MEFFKKQWPHLAALAGLFLLACLFFSPAVFSGKALPQPDNDKARAMQTETQKYLKETGEAPNWTNSAFGGMPAFQIYQPLPSNLTKPIFYGLLLGKGVAAPHTAIFLAMMSLYLLLVVCRVDWRVAALGAATFGVSVYNADIIEAGHSTKMIAIGLLPGVFAGAILCYHGQFLLGGGLAALFMAMQVYANHVQITYYSMMILGILALAKLFEMLRGGRSMLWAQGSAALALAVALGVGANAARILPTMEYGQETIRGKSELKAKAEKGDGLDRDYLFGWSYGVAESMTLLVPHFAGGGAGEQIKGTALGKKINDQRTASRLMYSGDQPFVGTAIYFGAACLFLFFVGAFLVRGAEKWWLVGGALFMLSLAWGKNFFLNHVFYDYLPMFKKFRAVSMALGLSQMMVCILAALGLQELFDQDVSAEKKRKALLFGLAAAGGASLLALLYSFVGSFEGANDARNFAQNQELLPILKGDRAGLCRSDALRSLGIVLASFGILWLFLKGVLKSWLAVALVFLVAVGDVWSVASRTLNASKYESARKVEAAPEPLEADKQAMADRTDPHFRVIDLVRGDITTNYEPSFFHKNISGYSAAKLALVQDVFDAHFSKSLESALPIAGMLNAKYVIGGPQGQPPIAQRNPSAMGNAWFGKKAVVVADADAELAGLAKFNPRDSFLVQQKFADQLAGWQPSADSTDYIKLTSYHPDRMAYEFSAKTDQIALFSEVFYPHEKGWNLYLNGSLAANQIFKANYLLRAARVPAGQKQVLEMRFEPKSVKTGSTMGYVSSALVLLFCLAGLFFQFKNGAWAEPSQLADVEKRAEEKPQAEPPKSGKGKRGA